MKKPLSRLVVLGGNQMAAPAILRMRERGHQVIVIDGSPTAPARLVADQFIHQNFAEVAATSEALRELEFEGIIPLNDFAIHAAAQIARERGLAGWTKFAERCLTSKIAMKKAWTNAGLPTARWASTTLTALRSGQLPEWHSWPAIVKPSFSGGGSRGVFMAQSWPEIIAELDAVGNRYLDGDIVIEEYIDGTEHTLEVLVTKGTPTLLSISDKQNYHGNITVVQNLYFPGPLGHRHREQLQTLVEGACAALQLSDGTAHIEVLIRDGIAYLLEVGGRPGGGLNFHPICELSTGYDYPSLLASVASSQQPDFSRKTAWHLAWHYFPAGVGRLSAIEGFDALREQPDVVSAELYETLGQPRLDLRDDLARPGYVLVRGSSHAQAKARAAALVEGIRFVVSD